MNTVPLWQERWCQWHKPRAAQLYQEADILWVCADFLDAEMVEQVPTNLLDELRALADGGIKARDVLALVRAYGLPVPPSERQHFVPSKDSEEDFWERFGSGDWWGTKVSTVAEYAALIDAAIRIHSYVQGQQRGGYKGIEAYTGKLKRFIRKNGLWWHQCHEFFLSERLKEDTERKEGRRERELYLRERGRWDEIQMRRLGYLCEWWIAQGTGGRRFTILPNGEARAYRATEIWDVVGELLSLQVLGFQPRKAVLCSFCSREYQLKRAPRRTAKFHCCGRLQCRREYDALRKRRSRQPRL